MPAFSAPGLRGPGTLRLAVLADDDAGGDDRAGRQLAQLPLRHGVFAGGMLGGDGGLDAVEQPFQPADQLGLGNAEFRVGRRGLSRETAG